MSKSGFDKQPEETARLVSEASNGDPVAVDALLEKFLPGLRGFLRLRAGQMLLAKESCSDLAQSVCRDVLENMGRFEYDGETGFRRWLYTTASRKVADRYEFYRAQRRDVAREKAPGGSGDEDALLASYRSFYTPSQQAVAREELARVEQAFQRLPEDQQQVILMAKMMGLPRAQIAIEMGRTEGSVRTLLCRALAQLADLLEGAPGQPGGENRVP